MAAVAVNPGEIPFLSLALLAYNEEKTVEEAARRCSRGLTACGQSYELVLVDDGSNDQTPAIMDRLSQELPFCRLIRHPRNLGIGAGIRTSYFATRGTWATFFPADLQADPAEVPRLVEALDGCDVLVTYRETASRQVSPLRKLISMTDRTLVQVLFGLRLRDLHWVRFFKRDFLDRMQVRATSPSVDIEMLVAAKRLGARFREVRLQDNARQFGVARGATLKNVVGAVEDLLVLRLRGTRLAREEDSARARDR